MASKFDNLIKEGNIYSISEAIVKPAGKFN